MFVCCVCSSVVHVFMFVFCAFVVNMFLFLCVLLFFFVFQAEDGIRDLVRSRGLGDVYKRQPQRVDSGWVQLFDGKSLDGWQITNFGTQGTVQVIEGEIVLGMGDGCTGITWNGNFPKTDYEVKLLSLIHI